MATDISRYVQDINNKEKGETVRDAIIGALRVIYGQGVSASMLNGAPLSEFVVHILNESNPATNWNETELLTKDMVDKINYGLTRSEDPSVVTQTAIGPSGSFSSQDAEAAQPGIYSFNRLAKTKKDIRDAINAAWRNTPSGAHTDSEYLVLSQDPFEDYPNFISLIGVGEGYTNSVSTLEVTENGLYTAPAGTGYDKVNVNVQELVIRPLTTEIEADGTYTASNIGADGFSFVTVHVPVIDPSDPSYDPETAYDPEAWSQGGSPETGITAEFYSKGVRKATQNLEYGETPHYDGTLPHDDDEYFLSWNPSLGPLTHNQKYDAIFKKIEYVDVSTGEITDSWETIAGNKGEPYPVGSWKVMDFGKVKKYTGVNSSGEPVYTDINIGKHVMIKAAGANETDETTSTWICAEAISVGVPVSNTRTAYDIASSKEDGDLLTFGDTDLYDFLNGTGTGVIHNIFENLNPFIITQMKRVNKKAFGIRLRQSGTSSKSFYFNGNEIVEENHLFWIPSNDEIFNKKSPYSNGSQGINAKEVGYYRINDSTIDGTVDFASAVIKTLDCGGVNYSDFFFSKNGIKQEYYWTDWIYNQGTATALQGNYAIKPYKASWSPDKLDNSWYMTKPITSNVSHTSGNWWNNDSGYRIGTRDILLMYHADTIDSDTGKIVTSSTPYTSRAIFGSMPSTDATYNAMTTRIPIASVRFGWDYSGTGRYYKYPIAANGWLENAITGGNSYYASDVDSKSTTTILGRSISKNYNSTYDANTMNAYGTRQIIGFCF